MNAPSMQWYPGDWLRDPNLRACSAAARGVWADMLAVMHQCAPYGVLLINGQAPDVKTLARMLSENAAVVAKALAELERRGVFSRQQDGTIYSRRMVRDAERSRQNRENGKRGGNPALTDKAADNQPDKPSHKSRERGGAEGEDEEGVGSPSDSEPREQQVFDRDEYAPLRQHAAIVQAWSRWLEHADAPGTKARPPAPTTAATILNRALKCVRDGKPELFVEAVDDAIANNWQGVNPKWSNGHGNGRVNSNGPPPSKTQAKLDFLRGDTNKSEGRVLDVRTA